MYDLMVSQMVVFLLILVFYCMDTLMLLVLNYNVCRYIIKLNIRLYEELC